MKARLFYLLFLASFFVILISCEDESSVQQHDLQKISGEGKIKFDIDFLQWKQLQDTLFEKVMTAIIENPDFVPLLEEVIQKHNENKALEVIEILGFSSKNEYLAHTEKVNILMDKVKAKYVFDNEILQKEVRAINLENNFVEPSCVELANFQYDICIWNPGYCNGYTGWLNNACCWLNLSVAIGRCDVYIPYLH